MNFRVSAVWSRLDEPFVSAATRKWMKELDLGAEVMMLVQDASRPGGIKSPTSKSILFSSPLRGDLTIKEQWDGLVSRHRTLTLDIWEPLEPPDYRKVLYQGYRPSIGEWVKAAHQAVAIRPRMVTIRNEDPNPNSQYSDAVIRAVVPIFEAADIPTSANHPLTTYWERHLAVRREWSLATTKTIVQRLLADSRAIIGETWMGAMPNNSTWTDEGAAKYMESVRESKWLGRPVYLFVAAPKRREWGSSVYETGLIDHEGNVSAAGRLLESILRPVVEPEPEINVNAAVRKIEKQVKEGEQHWARYDRRGVMKLPIRPTKIVSNILDDLGQPWERE